jgi:phosphonate transport system ATP-binding protein
MMAQLKIKNLTKYYKDVLALKEVNATIKRGQFVSIIGPSGSGKSTLLRCLNRMIEPSSGEVIFENIDVTKVGSKQLRKTRAQMGMIFQHYNLVSRLSVFENVLHGRLGYKNTWDGIISNYSEEEKEQAAEIISMLGLSDQIYKRCDALSGGQKQRVGIARALVQNPTILLCDEPIASLDPSSSKVIMDQLRKICDTMGITVLVNLHQVNVALKYSDRVIGINSGELVFDDSPQNLSKELINQVYGSAAGELITD